MPAWLADGDCGSRESPGAYSVWAFPGRHSRRPATGAGALCRYRAGACRSGDRGAAPRGCGPGNGSLCAHTNGARSARAAGTLCGGLALGPYPAEYAGSGARERSVYGVAPLADEHCTSHSFGDHAGVDDPYVRTASLYALAGGAAGTSARLYSRSAALAVPSWVSAGAAARCPDGGAAACVYAS